VAKSISFKYFLHIYNTVKLQLKCTKMKKFTITKKIAKSGNNNIIIIPKYFKEVLKPNTIVKLDIEIMDLSEQKND